MNKNIFPILLVAILISFNSIAQVQINLNVDSNPTPELYEWANRSELAILTITNTEKDYVGLDYKVKVKVLLDGDLVFETNNNVFTQKLELGVQTFLADEIIPYDAIDFKQNSFKNKIIQTGLLPAGLYSFCVSLIRLDGKTISTPGEVCNTMLITEFQLPELLYPIDNVVIQENLAPSILFTWSPISPNPPASLGVKYIIAITEIQPGQSVSQAFHVNYPVVEEEIIGTTQFSWPLDLDIPDETTKYVWSIKPVTFNDNPYKSGVNGFSYIQTFTISNKNLDSISTLNSSEKTEINNTNTGNEIEIIEKADIKAMHESLVNLTVKAPNSTNIPISIKQQNLNYISIENIAEKLVGIKQTNLDKSETFTKKEKKLQLANIKEMAESLVNLKIKNGVIPQDISKKDKQADIKAMTESLVNLTVKN